MKYSVLVDCNTMSKAKMIANLAITVDPTAEVEIAELDSGGALSDRALKSRQYTQQRF